MQKLFELAKQSGYEDDFSAERNENFVLFFRAYMEGIDEEEEV